MCCRMVKEKGARLKGERKEKGGAGGGGEEKEQRISSSVVFGAVVSVVALKVLLIPAYTSTDFEVHRNWLSLTWRLPLSQWYWEATSEWTLDYPPLFAYFELALAAVAKGVGLESILKIQPTALMNWEVLMFQRLSVIATDMFFMFSCWLACSTIGGPGRWANLPKGVSVPASRGCLLLLIASTHLISLDNVHFQYNSMLTGWVVLTVWAVDRRKYLWAALFYCILVNFKHIYLYYAPAFVAYYLRHYLLADGLSAVGKVMRRGVLLALSLLIPFLASLGPFVWLGGWKELEQIGKRLFPVSRGLTHAYWAPNVWALYNVVDMAAYRAAVLTGNAHALLPPTYSSGLVQTYPHSVLPSISPPISLACIIGGLTPVILLAAWKRGKTDMSVYMVLSAFSFFFFGYHVHEKALILITIPLTFAAFSDARYLRVFLLFSTITSFSLMPLLFTMFEIPIKYCLCASYLLLSLWTAERVWRVRMSSLVPLSVWTYFALLSGVELYNTLAHKWLFSGHLPFLPLLTISVVNACGVLFCYAWICTIAFSEECIGWWKWRLERRERRALSHSLASSSLPLSSIHCIAGVDVSASVSDPSLAVATLCVFSYPEAEPLYSLDDTCIIPAPYISDYLAMREIQPIRRLLQRAKKEGRRLPDVILVDGNGQWHARGCGLACHVAAETDIPTVGVAKKMNTSLLKRLGGEEAVHKADKLVSIVSEQRVAGSCPMDVVSPVVMSVVRGESSHNPLFVSPGLGVSLQVATHIALHTMQTRVAAPIRAADLRSRERVRKYFDS